MQHFFNNFKHFLKAVYIIMNLGISQIFQYTDSFPKNKLKLLFLQTFKGETQEESQTGHHSSLIRVVWTNIV